MSRTLDDDVVAMVTGPGSVLVQNATGATRGLWGEADVAVDVGSHSVMTTARALVVASSLVTDLAIAREGSIEVGAVDDDETLTTYKVVDVVRDADGLVTRLVVSA